MQKEDTIFVSHDRKPVMEGDAVYVVILSSAGFCTSKYKARKGLDKETGYDGSPYVIFKSRYLAKKYEAKRINFMKRNSDYYSNLSYHYNNLD